MKYLRMLGTQAVFIAILWFSTSLAAWLSLFASTMVMAHQDNYQQAPALGYPEQRGQPHYESEYYPPRSTSSQRHRHKHRKHTRVFQLENGSGQCLAATPQRRKGAGVEAYRCMDHPSQWWRQSGDQLINQGLCLTVRHRDGLYNGQKIKLRSCNGSAQQDWYHDRHERLQHRRGFCLDLDSNSMYRDGGKIQLWDCHRHKNQRWSRYVAKPRHHRH